jgi:hypothetical protein
MSDKTCRMLPEALGVTSMADDKSAGDGTAAGCAGERRQRFVKGGKSTDLGAESGDPGLTQFRVTKSSDPGLKTD